MRDYDDGRKHYDVVLPDVQPQQVSVVDIKHLRDTGTPDRNGQVLPHDVEYGGSAIFMEHGALVVSDPTYMFPAPAETGSQGPEGPNEVDGPDWGHSGRL